jgi:hypothetical protein
VSGQWRAERRQERARPSAFVGSGSAADRPQPEGVSVAATQDVDIFTRGQDQAAQRAARGQGRAEGRGEGAGRPGRGRSLVPVHVVC